ncbi:uncharacterized protein [Euphorbia lathyris]|uniref:uncharacterized protein n=1 Tax=Euphorbia lathyris TaxID=212925 RepID=UPI0033139E40
MSRFLAKTFHRSFFLPAKVPSFAVNCRYCSFKPQFTEIDLASCSSSTASEVDGDERIRMMEDLVNRVMLRNSTPDWLPFLPGSSFWVPPANPCLNATDLDQKLVDSFTAEEFIALTSRGLPSYEYFVSGDASEEANSEVKIMVGGREITIQMQKEDDGVEEMEFIEDSDAEDQDQEG